MNGRRSGTGHDDTRRRLRSGDSRRDTFSAGSESGAAAGPRSRSGEGPDQIAAARRCARISGAPKTKGRRDFGGERGSACRPSEVVEDGRSRPWRQWDRLARYLAGVPVALRQCDRCGRGSDDRQPMFDPLLPRNARRSVRLCAGPRQMLANRQPQSDAQQEDAGRQYAADPGKPGCGRPMLRFCLPVEGSLHISRIPQHSFGGQVFDAQMLVKVTARRGSCRNRWL